MRLRSVFLVLVLVAMALAYHRLSGQQESESVVVDSIVVDAGSADGNAEDATPGVPDEPARPNDGAFVISLASQPQQFYLGEIDTDAGDTEFSGRVKALSKNKAHYDVWLSRAARELAFQGALMSESPPEPALTFILAASGAPEGSVAQLVVLAHGDSIDVIDDAIVGILKSAPTGRGRLVVGVGEAATESEDFERRVVVIVARRKFDLQPTLRSLPINENWHIAGQAPRGFTDAHASILYPDHRIVVLPVTMNGRSFEVDVPTGNLSGAVRVSIDGVGKDGPGKLLQLSLEVGGPPPKTFQVTLPSEEKFESLGVAEDQAFELLNRDREALGLPPLILDTELSDIARSHSIEMRDFSYFAHLSPYTGLAGDRLADARYRASAHGENLAFNDSVAEAQSSLMESVGHRRNIIETSMTHVGIGLAASAESPLRNWHLTQVFVRKVQPFDRVAASEEFLVRVNSAREESGVNSLTLNAQLVEIATQGCLDALEHDVNSLPKKLAEQASVIANARVAVSVHVFYDFSTLQPDDISVEAEFSRFGIAFLRDEENLKGRTILVQIVAE